jgi:hypothetical protein
MDRLFIHLIQASLIWRRDSDALEAHSGVQRIGAHVGAGERQRARERKGKPGRRGEAAGGGGSRGCSTVLAPRAQSAACSRCGGDHDA